jgi:hypothetical protein
MRNFLDLSGLFLDLFKKSAFGVTRSRVHDVYFWAWLAKYACLKNIEHTGSKGPRSSFLVGRVHVWWASKNANVPVLHTCSHEILRSLWALSVPTFRIFEEFDCKLGTHSIFSWELIVEFRRKCRSASSKPTMYGVCIF